MSTHPSSTSGRADLGIQETFEPFVDLPSATSFAKDEERDEAESKVAPQLADAPPKTSHFDTITNFYVTISWILGFNEKYSLALFIFFGGALVGFCLARTMMMSPANVRDMTVPGEWFWYRRNLYKPCIIIHIYLSIISGIFAVFQFIPAIRRRSIALHRLNGYLTLALLIPATILGSIVARRAFGGELNVQSAFYVNGCMTVFASLMGITNVKRTRKHRKWMLRTAAYVAVTITSRITSLAARRIISDIGSYYAVWRCDEVSFVLSNMSALQELYPRCAQAGDNLANVHVAIRAEVDGDKLSHSSSVRAVWGMSMWIAIVIHALGVEIYIRQTESANKYRYGFVLQRSANEPEKDIHDDR